MNATVLGYSSRAVGVVSLVLFTAVVVLGIATAGRTASAAFPRAPVLRRHRAALAFRLRPDRHPDTVARRSDGTPGRSLVSVGTSS